MEWFLYAFLSAVFFGLYIVLARVYSIDVVHARAYSVIWAGCAGVLLLPFVLATLASWDRESITQAALTTLGISILFYAIYDRTQFAVRKYLQASQAALLSQITPIASLLTLWVLAEESMTVTKILAMLCIVGGNVIVEYGSTSLWERRGVILGLLSFGALGIAFAFDKIASSVFPIPLYAMMVYLLPAILNVALPPLRISALRRQAASIHGTIWLLAAVNVLGTFFYLLAFRTGEGGPVLLVVSTSIILAVLLGIVVLKERDRLLQKVIATILVAIGLVLLL